MADDPQVPHGQQLGLLQQTPSPNTYAPVVQQAIQSADQRLQHLDPSPFSPEGFETYKQQVAIFAEELATELIRNMQRKQSVRVSPNDVQRASENLVTATSRRYVKHLGTVGGLLTGAAAGNILAMTTTKSFPVVGTLISILLLAIGTAMVAWYIAKE